MTPRPLVFAVPKGRTIKPLSALLSRAGIDTTSLLAEGRELVREASNLRFLLLKPDDVPTYVEHGAADIGVCGRDVLRERGSDVLVPVDLGLGRCRMVVAGLTTPRTVTTLPRVATKYPTTATEHFARRGLQAEVIYIQGSVELAPLVGLSDLIVDLVETGETLAKNGLTVIEEIAEVTSVLIANRASYKLRRLDIGPLVERIRLAVE